MLQEILWYKNGTSDKIWGVVQLSDNREYQNTFTPEHNFVVFWGRRGQALQTQLLMGESIFDMQKKVREKKNKGYKNINKEQIYDVYPEFKEDLNRLVFIAKLSQ